MANLNIINIMLTSLDGKIAFHANESTAERNNNSFTCPEDFERMRELVAQCDAVFLGARSMESELGAFRVADLRQTKDEPEWIIFTQSGNISFQSPFWKQENFSKSIFFVSSFDMKEDPILKVEEKEFHFGKIICYLGNMKGLIQYLKNKNYTKTALLGGGKLNSVFWKNNLINELYITISPFVVCTENSVNFLNIKSNFKKKLILKQCKTKNGFVFLDYLLPLSIYNE